MAKKILFMRWNSRGQIKGSGWHTIAGAKSLKKKGWKLKKAKIQ